MNVSNYCLPEFDSAHSSSSHLAELTFAPYTVQFFPPYLGGGLVQFRERVLIHCEEHLLHSDHDV